MKLAKKLLPFLLGSLVLSGCAGVRCGIGYYKRPLPPEKRAELLGISPAVAEAIAAVIGSENFARMVEAAIPPDEEVILGIYWLRDPK